jgi:hypothetical protein
MFDGRSFPCRSLGNGRGRDELSVGVAEVCARVWCRGYAYADWE